MTGLERIIENKTNSENGGKNCLPMPFHELSQYIAGFRKGLNCCISANSGIGKSTLSKFLLINFVDWAIKNDVELHVYYFALEESKEIFECTILLNKLYSTYNVRIDLDELLSNRKTLPDRALELLQELENTYMVEFRKRVEVIDYLSTPTGIFKHCTDSISQFGEVEYTDDTNKYIKSFTYHNPNAFFVIFNDHLGELDTESGKDLAGCMQTWSNYALKTLCKKLNCIVFNVHQQNAEQEDVEHIKLSKIKPSLNGLGDNKKVGRAYRLCIGLTSPHKYDLTTYEGYPVNQMKDNFRILNIFKNNFGTSNLSVGMYFDGMTLTMDEISKNDSAKLRSTIDKINNLTKTTL